MKRRPSWCASVVVWMALAGAGAAAEPPKLVVHEWGTFTCLQDEDGHAVSSINVEDEPLPWFVGRVGLFLAYQNSPLPPNFFQGTPAGHPDVTMRLETPVLYFHPADHAKPIAGVTVKASFHGGWLTEFYPHPTTVVAPGIERTRPAFGHLGADTIGSLTWADLTLGPVGSFSQAAEKYNIWLAPRAVEAAMVTSTKTNEREQYLFYRGVGHVDAPLTVVRDAAQDVLKITAAPASASQGHQGSGIDRLWLVDVRADKAVAFRKIAIRDDSASHGKLNTQTSAHFADGDYHADGLEALRRDMQHSLTGAGLFADEAKAMLETWKLSYFQSPGLRLFFVVPRVWSDAVLPLEISVPADLTRVMVGRIELVTPEQRKLLRTIAAGPAPKSEELATMLRSAATQPRNGSPADAALPPVQQAYVRLDRFRQALVLDEARRRPTPELTEFIKRYGLQPYEVPQ